jgi:hypothetical protein
MDALEQVMDMNRRLQASLLLQEFVRNRWLRQDVTRARRRRVMIDAIGPAPSSPPPIPAKIWTVEDLVDAMLDDDRILHAEHDVDENPGRVDVPLNNEPELADAAVGFMLDDANNFDVEHDVDDMWSPADEIPSRQGEEPEEEVPEERRTEAEWAELQRRRARQVEELRRALDTKRKELGAMEEEMARLKVESRRNLDH